MPDKNPGCPLARHITCYPPTKGYANVYGVATAHYLLATESKMTTTSQISSSRIARRAEQGARPTIPTQVAVDKLATESYLNVKIKSNQYKMYL